MSLKWKLLTTNTAVKNYKKEKAWVTEKLVECRPGHPPL